jgi:hypothetical protein
LGLLQLDNKKIKKLRTADTKAQKKPETIAPGLSLNLKALSIIYFLPHSEGLYFAGINPKNGIQRTKINQTG